LSRVEGTPRPPRHGPLAGRQLPLRGRPGLDDGRHRV